MDVTITNVSSDQLFIPGPNVDLPVGSQATISMTVGDMEDNTVLRDLVAQAKVTLVFSRDTNADITHGFGHVPQSFTTASRPAPGAVPIFTWIFNMDDDAPNWSDGTDWRDAAGVIT